MSTILTGIPLRDKIKEELHAVVATLSNPPQLAIIQAGTNEASISYINGKIKFGKEIGIEVVLHHISESASEEELIDLLLGLNMDPRVEGIIVQLPLPSQMNEERVVEMIDPEKDVDGLHSTNMKKLLIGSYELDAIMPATTKGILTLLDSYKITLKGRRVLMIGRSNLVGKPTALALLNRDATVTVAHHLSGELIPLTKDADIIVVATGVAGLITKDHVKPGQIIIDVGINRIEGKVVGDVAYDEVSAIVSAISPVPGGVGPLTIASLFQNLLRKYTNGKH